MNDSAPSVQVTGPAGLLEFRLLGPLEVRDGTRDLTPRPAKQRALLAGLLLDAGRMVTLDRIMRLVWGEEPPVSAEPVVRVYVSALRRLLGSEVLLTRPGGYLLAVDPEQVDMHRFERLQSEARRAADAGRLDAAAQTLKTALALWRGDALSGIESETLRHGEAPRLNELRLSAQEERVECDLRLGRHEEVVGELRRLVTSYPLRERPWCQLMLALYRCGRRGDAQQVYLDVRRVLTEQLGVEPGPQLRELQTRILADDPGLAAPGGAREWRSPVPRELPNDIADFTARSEELGWITEVVGATGSASCRILLHGPPGAGKTAVAVHAAHRLAGRFPDGQIHVDLRGHLPADVEAVTAVQADFLRSLGCPDGAIPAGSAERARLLRSMTAGKRLLVLLDNAGGESQVRLLAAAAPGCLTLVTSRSSLPGLEDVHARRIDVLPAAQAEEMLARLVGRHRVTAEPEEARRVIALCAGLPLALRIAGARLARRPDWTLGSLATRLAGERDRLDELRAGDLAVRGSLELSYAALTDDERRLLRHLALPAAEGFASWTVAALLGIEPARATRGLDALVEAGLLQSLGTDEAGQERHRLHDLTRLYAQERLNANGRTDGEVGREAGGQASGEADVALRRLARDALDRARQMRARLAPLEAGDTQISGIAPVPATMEIRASADWLAVERTVLVQLLTDLHGSGMFEDAWRLAVQLTPFFEARGLHDDWRRAAAICLQAARRWGDRQAEATALRVLGDLNRARGDLAEAEQALSAGAQLCDLGGSARDAAHIRWRLALVRLEQGDPRAAEQDLGGCLKIFESVADRRGVAEARRGLGGCARLRADLEAAAGWLGSAAADFADLGDRRRHAETLHELGLTRLAQGRLEDARRHLEESLRTARRLGDRLPEAAGLTAFAELHRAEGRPAASRAAAAGALDIHLDFGDRRGAARARLALGLALLDLGEPDAAGGHLADAERILAELGDRVGVAQVWCAVGESRLRTADMAAAVESFTAAHAYFAGAGLRLLAERAGRGRAMAARLV